MSNAFEEPDWATPGSTTAAAPTQEITGDSFNQGSNGGSDRSGLILVLMSMLNIGLSAMMVALGVLGILDFDGKGVEDYSDAFIAGYMIVFAVLLFAYECMWWKAIGPINQSLRKNFGFMYGLKGKGLYLIFISFLTIGLSDESENVELQWATGISYMAAGFLHLFVVFAKPEITLKYKAPTRGFESKEEPINPV